MKNIIIFCLVLIFSHQSFSAKVSARFVRNLDGMLEIAKQNVPLHSSVNKFGKTENADSGIATDVWDGATTTPVWVAPTESRIHDIVSSSASDDGAPAGVGAQTIRIWGLPDWDTKEISEDIILNGLTDVPTINAYVIIHRMQVLTSGTTSIVVGNISATAQTDGTVTAQIKVGLGQTQMAILGIPSVQTAYFTNFWATGRKGGGAAKLIDIGLLVNIDPENGKNFLVQETGSVTGVGGPPFRIPFLPHRQLVGPAIIKIQANSNANDSEVAGGFDIILVDQGS